MVKNKTLQADDSLSPLQKVHFASLKPRNYSKKQSLQDIVYIDLAEIQIPSGKEVGCNAYSLSYEGALDVLLRNHADVLSANEVAQVFLTEKENISLVHVVVRKYFLSP